MMMYDKEKFSEEIVDWENKYGKGPYNKTIIKQVNYPRLKFVGFLKVIS